MTIERVRTAVIDGINAVNETIGKTEEVTIGDDETFSDYGLDSLDQMNLVIELEQSLGTDLESVDMAQINSIAKLHRFVENA
jgi:acyl carrier protein